MYHTLLHHCMLISIFFIQEKNRSIVLQPTPMLKPLALKRSLWQTNIINSKKFELTLLLIDGVVSVK